jgi:hypothetical protein
LSDTWNNAPLATTLAPPKEPAPSTSWDSAPFAQGPSPQTKAVVQANDNSEEAGRAVAVSKKLALPASLVQSDVPGYEASAREKSAREASQNPALAGYIQKNPMAASISADDWDKMDEVSQTLRLLHPELLQSKAQGGVFSMVPEIRDLMQTEEGITRLRDALIGLPFHLAKGLYDFGKSLVTKPGEVYERGMTSDDPEVLSMGLGLALGAAGPKGSVVAGRPRIEVRGGDYMSFDDFMHKLDGMETRQEIDDFIAKKAGGGPMLQIEYAKAGSDALDKAVQVSQESKTKERSPELFEAAAAEHDPGVVHISAEKIMDLYRSEGKTPAEGDGLLGFVPDIVNKLRQASASGGEVTIPVAQYIAHVDEAVHEKLREDVRLHDDGTTLTEAKELEEAFKVEQAQVVEPQTVEQSSTEAQPVIVPQMTAIGPKPWTRFQEDGFLKTYGLSDREIQELNNPQRTERLEKAEAVFTEHAVEQNKLIEAKRVRDLSPSAETTKGKPGANLGRLTNLLGENLYGAPTNMTAVSVKEMMQNAFDAIKGMIEKGKIKEGKINMTWIDKHAPSQSRTTVRA